MVWNERGNARMVNSYERFPAATVPKVAIIQPKQHWRPQQRKRIFVGSPSSYGYVCFLGEDGGPNDYIGHDREDRSEHDKQELRDAMSILLTCAQRIAAHSNSETTYPSAEYLMRALPTWLHKPANFDCKAAHQDRETVVEFDYRPAATLAAWEANVPPPFYDGIYQHNLRDLPQYRDS